MNCPKCGASMEKVVYQTVEVERCTRCGGIWFDQFEKEALKALRGADEVVDTGSQKLGEAYNRVDRVNCPHCDTLMTRLVDAKQPHIWYESCSVCYGVFFDAGEFTDYQHETVGDFFKRLLAQDRENG